MLLSVYLKVYPCRDNPDRVLLFSTRRLSKVIVSRALLRAVEDGTLSAGNRETLRRLGILVDDRDAERREMLTILAEAEKRKKQAFLMAVMNLDCNLACCYCYEGKLRGRNYMSAETADLLATFCEREFLQQGKNLVVDFYGGEPLLSLGLIRNLSHRLKASAEREGREYGFTLVTNGTLLTSEVVSELLPLGLKSVRITLDGPREIHDRYRPFRSGKGSFDTIVGNLLDICNLTRVGIGGNYTKDTYREFPRLLDDLFTQGITPDRISHVHFAPVSDTLGEHLRPEFSEGCCSTDEPWLSEASLYLREEILRRGYYTPKVSPIVCMIELRDSLVVNFDGTLYKCPAFIGCEGLDAGHLASGFRDCRESYNADVWKKEECLDCAYLPLCFGGCRFLRLLQQDAIDDVECRKAWYDATLEELILQDLRHAGK